ncbi:MAG: enoyl-CoA hydratase-related protein [Acidimicrobiales bacterium]
MSDERPLDEQVLFSRRDGVAWITLNRPEAHNAITPDQRNRVIDLLEQASGDLTTRAVVLTATGRGFCTGADLRGGRTHTPERPADAPERAVGEVSRLIRVGAQRLIAAILDCEKPVIAAVNGTAAGIGAHMAFACDLVLAASSARFIEVFVRRGLVPDGGGAYLLPRLIGLQKTKELMFFGDALSAEDAASLGLVNRVVDDDRLEEVATEWASRLAHGPTRSIALTKWLLNRSLETDRAGAFADEAVAQELNMGTHDAQEGVASFVERRDPDFKGW